MTTHEYQELKTLILEQTTELVKRMHDEHAETREYIDRRIGQMQVEMNGRITEKRGITELEFKRTRDLVRSEFAKAAEHANRLVARRG